MLQKKLAANLSINGLSTIFPQGKGGRSTAYIVNRELARPFDIEDSLYHKEALLRPKDY